MLEVRIDRIEVVRLSGSVTTLVEDVVFDLGAGQSLGIVGESGSGKSMLAFSMMGLLPKGVRAKGKVFLQGQDLLVVSERELQDIRGSKIGMIFQEPMTALSPTMKIGDQVAESLMRHRGMTRRSAQAEALRLLDRVRIPDARKRLSAYPHELSGGQRQRVVIAIAIAPSPALLLADEPTTALDVTVQAEILQLLAELVEDMKMSMIIISHDLGVINAVSDRTLVMYAGAAVESGETQQVLREPSHPYTRALLASLPRRTSYSFNRLPTIPGSVPLPGSWPRGCRFSTRCGAVTSICNEQSPTWHETGSDWMTRCHLAGAI